jgi:hypothetical protein
MSDTYELDKHINYDNRVVYNYPKRSINKNEITSTPTKLEMTFFNGSTDPNIIYTLKGANTVYNHSKAYFYTLIHDNIGEVTNGRDAARKYGELIIEHKPPGSTNKIFVCFLLEYTDSDQITDIDTMINFKTANKLSLYADVELNSVIPKQDSCVVYDSVVSNVKSTVFVFTTPIKINAASKKRILQCKDVANVPIVKYNSGYIVLPARNISLPDPDQIYINCNPTGESADKIDTYNLPINSVSGSEQDAKSAMQTMTMFAIFVIVSVGLVAFVPGIYKFTVLQRALTLTRSKTEDFLEYMRALDGALIAVFGIISFSLIISGFSTENAVALSFGFSFLYMIIASMWILYIKRHDREYMTVGTYNSYDPKVEYEPPAFDKIASALGAVLTLGAFGSPQ